MKKTIIISAAAIVFFFTSCGSSTTTGGDKDAKVQSADSVQRFSFDTTTLAAGKEYYQCPMHPHIISDKPGLCPECGEMELEKVIKQ